MIDPEQLRRFVADRPGEAGVRPLRRLLDRDTFRISDSELEVRFRRLSTQAGLSVPETQSWLLGFRVDFHWPDLGLVVETDGLRYHRTASAQARDQLRDQVHTAAGLTTLRFSHWQVSFEPDHVARILRQTAAHLSAGPEGS